MKVYKFILKAIIIMTLFSSLFSCKEKENIYIYGTNEFSVKEKELKLSLDEASNLYTKFIFNDKNIRSESVSCRLDIIYGNNYIFKKKWEPYNLKTAEYNLSGIWINGETGEVKNVNTNKKIKVVLEPNKHVPYSKKVTNNFLNTVHY